MLFRDVALTASMVSGDNAERPYGSGWPKGRDLYPFYCNLEGFGQAVDQHFLN